MNVQPPYASFRRGVIVRLSTGLLIWCLAAAAHAVGIIGLPNLVGISVSVAIIFVMAFVFLLFFERAIEAGRPPIASILDRLFVLVGYAGVMHSLGGVE